MKATILFHIQLKSELTKFVNFANLFFYFVTHKTNVIIYILSANDKNDDTHI